MEGYRFIKEQLSFDGTSSVSNGGGSLNHLTGECDGLCLVRYLN